MTDHWADIRQSIAAKTEQRLDRLESAWGVRNRRDSLSLGPRDHDPDSPPESVAACLDHIGGIASVVVFYSEHRRETVLVYNPGGWWEPPGGVVEDGASLEATAKAETREETGLEITLTELLYTRRVEFAFADGSVLELPVAQFAGHRTAGRLGVEREGRTHPGCTRAVGLFDADTLPELPRDREEILGLLDDPPAWTPPEQS